MVVHQQPFVLDGADAGPFRLPFVVPAMGGFGQPIGAPHFVRSGKNLKDRRGPIPARGEDIMAAGAQAAQPGKGLALDHAPLAAIVFRERSFPLQAAMAGVASTSR